MDDPRVSHQVRGRGSASNHVGRFERLERVAVDDGWDGDGDPLPPLRTETRIERPRRMISYNRSPDLSFDRSINPYRGCEHGCVYCFARPSHAYLGMSPGLDFETRLLARPEAPDVLARELAARSYRVAPLAIGTNTDPYQPIEKKYGIMRACLQLLLETRHPVAIVTRGSLIERDLDILSNLARQGLVNVGITVTTLNRDLARKMEPRAPAPARRLQMIAQLAEAGVPVRIMASPMVPALTDPELEAILTAAQAAGARYAHWSMLRLPREVAPFVAEWLQTHAPGSADRILNRLREMHGGKLYDARWHHRMRGEGHYAQIVAQRFKGTVRRLGLLTATPALRCDLFTPPVLKGQQMSLF